MLDIASIEPLRYASEIKAKFIQTKAEAINDDTNCFFFSKYNLIKKMSLTL